MTTRQIALLLSLFAAAHGAVGTTPLINATCAAASRNATMFTHYDYCVRALSDDPAASSATDARGLAAAAVSLTVVNITYTEDIVSDLLQNLGRCLKNYREMNAMVAPALDDIRAGRAGEASKKLLKAVDEDFPSWCDLILIEGDARRNPIDHENHNIHLVSAMASDITELLLRSHALSPKVSS
ncbi:unnamed protein product [Alopecurus aequalis]